MGKQLYYPKINTLWARGEDFKVRPGAYSLPEFECIDPWDVFEKIDGMNVSLFFTKAVPWPEVRMDYDIRGRGPNTNWRQDQLDYMRVQMHQAYPYVRDMMNAHELYTYEIFGELFGPGIQSGGVYGNDIQFRFFDVRVDEKVWLDTDTLVQVSKDSGLPQVPYLGTYDANTVSSDVRAGIPSAFNPDHTMEGVVAKPPVRLFNIKGERVIWKLKTKDFA
jgi:hypothetical protein